MPVALAVALAIALGLGGCALQTPQMVNAQARLTPLSPHARDLLKLPPPKGKIVVAVYGLRDQTGQYKPAPDSSFSTAVTQGAAAMLISALRDSGWFTPVEREGLQNILTERRIIRAIENPADKGNPAIQLPALMPAQVLIEGGVVAYETNTRTGGAGIKYLGGSLFGQYRVDQVTVALRVVDIRSGQVLNSVSTSKTVYSRQLQSGVFRYVSFQKLLEAEAGFTMNEPPQLAVKAAIEAGVIHLVAQGLRDKQWSLRDDKDLDAPVIQAYLREADELALSPAGANPKALE
jgi:curli production assembly/transport component CsgG